MFLWILPRVPWPSQPTIIVNLIQFLGLNEALVKYSSQDKSDPLSIFVKFYLNTAIIIYLYIFYSSFYATAQVCT
jgi:hypothetical protein